MNYKKMLAPIAFIGALGWILLFSIESDLQAEKNLRLNKISVTGICTHVEYLRGGLRIRYYFVTRFNRYKEDRFWVRTKSKNTNEIRTFLIGKKLPVIYDSTNYRNNRILIFKDDFLNFHCPIPDSLVSLVSHIDSLKNDLIASGTTF